MRAAPAVIILAVVAALSGCSSKGLMDLRTNSEGPDEFMILPSKELEQPDNYSALPAPTPGGANRTDPNPNAEAVAALGGSPSALNAQGIPAADGALVTQTSRYGVEPDIRMTLAEADAEFRRKQSRGTRVRLFPVDRYSQAYRGSALDPFEEAERFRRAGFQTPTSPPLKP